MTISDLLLDAAKNLEDAATAIADGPTEAMRQAVQLLDSMRNLLAPNTGRCATSSLVYAEWQRLSKLQSDMRTRAAGLRRVANAV